MTLTASVLHRQDAGGATESKWPAGLKCLLPGPSQERSAMPWSRAPVPGLGCPTPSHSSTAFHVCPQVLYLKSGIPVVINTNILKSALHTVGSQ